MSDVIRESITSTYEDTRQFAEDHGLPTIPLPPSAFARTTPDPVPTVTPIPEFAEPELPAESEESTPRNYMTKPIRQLPHYKTKKERKKAGRKKGVPQVIDPMRRITLAKFDSNIPEEGITEQEVLEGKLGRHNRVKSTKMIVRALPELTKMMIEIGLGIKVVDKQQYDAIKELMSQGIGKAATKTPPKEESSNPVLTFDIPGLEELEANAVDRSEVESSIEQELNAESNPEGIQ
jgi:hypothetical protein